MMKKTTIFNSAAVLSFLVIALLSFGCKKYLDEKPNKSYAAPNSLADLQALMDYYPTMNTKDPSAGEISGDNYFVTDADYDGLSTESYRRMYTFQKDYLFDPQFNDWANAYKVIYIANLALDQLGSISKTDVTAWNNVRGQALVFRAKGFLQVAGIWSLAYDPASASQDLGIPLRLSSDNDVKTTRPTNKQTYDQIITDLKTAIPLLPAQQVTVLRPSKAAAYGLLARAYLQMGAFAQAGLYADSCLQLQHTLLDYGTLSASLRYPIAKLNAEVIFESSMPNGGPIVNAIAMIDTALISQYESNDLRRKVFFKSTPTGYYSFKGSYEGASTLFSGIAVDEMYLTRAESYARAGNTDAAMTDLNTLLRSRYDATFTGRTASDAGDALAQILAERRKELLMRGLRWEDIKRLNKTGTNIVLTRNVHGSVYTLPTNDLRYALPIPEDVIALTGMAQNPR